jgi:hypothetical protein
MKYTYDTEFIDNGETIEFLSIGIVAEDGREYYAITSNTEVLARARQNPWLKQNVLAQLPIIDIADAGGFGFNPNHADYQHVKPKHQIKEEISAFLRYEADIEYWAWFAAYDHVVLSQLFGRMLDLPMGFPMYTNDIKQEHRRLGYPRIPEQAQGAHNALEDARWNMDTLHYLEALESPKESVLAANPKRTRIW